MLNEEFSIHRHSIVHFLSILKNAETQEEGHTTLMHMLLQSDARELSSRTWIFILSFFQGSQIPLTFARRPPRAPPLPPLFHAEVLASTKLLCLFVHLSRHRRRNPGPAAPFPRLTTR